MIVSRTSPKFLEKLLELEIPEIAGGTIEIKDIVRQPGERAKVAVLDQGAGRRPDRRLHRRQRQPHPGHQQGARRRKDRHHRLVGQSPSLRQGRPQPGPDRIRPRPEQDGKDAPGHRRPGPAGPGHRQEAGSTSSWPRSSSAGRSASNSLENDNATEKEPPVTDTKTTKPAKPAKDAAPKPKPARLPAGGLDGQGPGGEAQGPAQGPPRQARGPRLPAERQRRHRRRPHGQGRGRPGHRHRDRVDRAGDAARGRKPQGRPRHPPAGRDHHGPRRPRQDDAPRRHPVLEPRGQGVGRHHPAHRRLPRPVQQALRSRSSTRRATRPSPSSAPAGRRSPTSSSSWWPPTRR